MERILSLNPGILAVAFLFGLHNGIRVHLALHQFPWSVLESFRRILGQLYGRARKLVKLRRHRISLHGLWFGIRVRTPIPYNGGCDQFAPLAFGRLQYSQLITIDSPFIGLSLISCSGIQLSRIN